MGIVNVIQIACGDDHCLVLTKGGQLYTWGDNQYGRLGFEPTTTHISIPTQIVGTEKREFSDREAVQRFMLEAV